MLIAVEEAQLDSARGKLVVSFIICRVHRVKKQYCGIIGTQLKWNLFNTTRN